MKKEAKQTLSADIQKDQAIESEADHKEENPQEKALEQKIAKLQKQKSFCQIAFVIVLVLFIITLALKMSM
jgi:uncharacterized membrane protein YcjF (UPF0283 family)